MKLIARLWNDEAGFVVSTELLLIGTILVLGMIVGLTTLRDAVVQEFGDLAQAIGNISQSYIYGGVSGHCSATAGSTFLDALDFCDAPGVAGISAPACVSVCAAINVGASATGEVVTPAPGL